MASSKKPDLPSFTAGTPRWDLIPGYMQPQLIDYVQTGRRPGDFLWSLLTNDLRRTFEYADDDNRSRVHDYLIFLHNYTPAGCWGSLEKVIAWGRRGGLNGGAVRDPFGDRTG